MCERKCPKISGLNPRLTPKELECGPGSREGMHLTQKSHAGPTTHRRPCQEALNDQLAALTSCRRDLNGFPCTAVPAQCAVADSCCASAFDRAAAGVCDVVALDLHCRAARFHGLHHDRCEPGENKPSQQLAPESVASYEQILSGAVPGDGE
jgi:hypothetical protein